MNDNWIDVSVKYAICAIKGITYFKGHYDDGCLYEVTWVSKPIECTLFRTSADAIKQMEDLKEENPKLLMCVVEVKTTCEVSMNF